jgi:hypothetical protein
VNWVDDDKVQELIPQIEAVLKRMPIVVDSQGWIIDGNHRAMAAGEAGLTSVPAYVPVKPGVVEGKIKLYTDPDYFGAEVDDYQASGPVQNIPVDLLVGFEPDSKMAQPESRANVQKIITGIKRGDVIPPILVRDYKDGYQILDGHHRFRAYKLLGVKSIPAQVVPDSDIEEISKPSVAENFADGRVKGKSRPGRVKRSGASCAGSVTDLRAKARKYGGERGKMYHWCANMKGGKK